MTDSKQKKKRDYKAEYQRRIKRGLAKGLTRSQASGHPKATEKYIKQPVPISDEIFQIGLKELRAGKSLSEVAKAIRVSPTRLRNQAKAKGAIRKKGRRWVVKKKLSREMLVYTKGEALTITVGTLHQASKVGKYMASVSNFIRSNNIDYLKPFISKFTTDIKKQKHEFETNPNTLYRLISTGNETFEQVYRIVI